ncbi:MAG: anhydro-N-acetylmuramic acid kinase [Lachnospiraceae bacterium]|jgi:anhydro-N-acetylmuramic acid kinase|nr:anhydro-N-acetylmuramic acid kinase [Lachnospiraceae bacterium]
MLYDIMQKNEKLVIGLMSGTSADGIDAVLVKISGHGIETKVEQLAFVSPPYTEEVRERILQVAAGNFGGSQELCLMNVLLGELFADACLMLCEKAGIQPSDVDLIGTHGQTVYHIPTAQPYLGHSITATLQIGEPSVLCERLGILTVSDFRVRDVAAGGFGAPLVPYTEYILYSDPTRHVGLQNIGGIGNITVLPAGGKLDDLTAFDTGPGNMLMDSVVGQITNGRLRYDEGGKIAASGRVSEALLEKLMQDPYLKQTPPKTTGREYYGQDFVRKIMQDGQALSLCDADILATTTMFTAASIAYSVNHHCQPKPQRLIVGGGGSLNPTLMQMIASCLPQVEVMTNEDLGLDSSAKEAVAFALLANETIHSQCNNAPAATGAKHPVIMGKICQ